MSDKGQLNNKDVQSHSNAVTGAVLGEMERLKEDLDRLHRERDSFQRQQNADVWDLQEVRN